MISYPARDGPGLRLVSPRKSSVSEVTPMSGRSADGEAVIATDAPVRPAVPNATATVPWEGGLAPPRRVLAALCGEGNIQVQ
jgi:hypothetical protein